MKLYRAKDYKDMSRKAANIISAQVIMKPNCVLGLATGSTPIGTYEQLVEWYKKGDLDFAEVKTANLDEYKGLPRDNEFYLAGCYYPFQNKSVHQKEALQMFSWITTSIAQPEVCESFHQALLSHRIDLGLHDLLEPSWGLDASAPVGRCLDFCRL